MNLTNLFKSAVSAMGLRVKHHSAIDSQNAERAYSPISILSECLRGRIARVAAMFALFLLCFSAQAASTVSLITVTATNAPTSNGMTFVYNSSTRMFSNSVAGSPSTTVLTNLTIGGSITNLYNNLAAYPLSGVLNVVRSGTNALIITTLPGTAPTITIGGTWGNYSISSGAATNQGRPFLAPYSVMPSTTGVYVASEIVTGLGYATNQASATNYYLTNFVNRSTAQTITGAKTFSGDVVLAGSANVLSGNFAFASGSLTEFGDGATLSLATNSSILGWDGTTTYSFQGATPNAAGVARFGDVTNILSIFKTNAQSFTGTNTFAQITNSTVTGSTITNSTFHGTLGVVSGGVTNLALTNSYTALQSTFDFKGDNAFQIYTISSLANSNNSAINLGTNVFVKLVSGPTAAFNLCGFLNGRNGKIYQVINATGYPMWIMHEDGNEATPANRIRTPNATNLICNGETAMTFIYDSVSSRWRVTGYTMDGTITITQSTNYTSGGTNIYLTNSFLIDSVIRNSQIGMTNGNASRAVATDASSNLVVSATTAAQLAYLADTTGLIQAQINAKGTVSSVAFTGDGVVFSNTVTGSPITATGTLQPSLIPQATNLVLAGPASGSTAAPTFRRIHTNDIPGLINATNIGAGAVSTVEYGYLDGVTSAVQTQIDAKGSVSSVALALPSIFSVSGSPVTGSGTLTGTLATETANTVFAGPALGSATMPTFRGLVSADIPNFALGKTIAGDLTMSSGRIDLSYDTAGVDFPDCQAIFSSGGTGQPAHISFNVDGVIANHIGSDDTGLRTFSQNGLSYAPFRVSVLTSSSAALGTVSSGTWNGTPIATAYIAASGVSAATYGGETNVPQIAVDVSGRITSASNVPITNLNVAAITAGTFAEARLGSGTGTSGKYLRGDSTWQTLNSTAVGLGSVENTALSTWAGSLNVTTLGTIAQGNWQGTSIAAAYLGAHTHAAADVTSGTFAEARLGSGTGTSAKYLRGDSAWATLNSTAVGLGSVENTALSTWAGSANVTTLGTISSGTWNGTPIAGTYLGGSINATNIGAGGVTSTEFGYIGTLTSDAQTQMNILAGFIDNVIAALPGKSDVGHTHAAADIVSGTLDAARLPVDATIPIIKYSAQFDKTDTTLANVTGVSVNIVSGSTYSFRAIIHVSTTGGAAGGAKYAIGGTSTASSFFIAQVNSWGVGTPTPILAARITSKGSSAGIVSSETDYYTVIEGSLICDGSGTLTLQFAQQADLNTSSVLTGSTFTVQKVL